MPGPTIDPQLLEMLVCPVTHSKLRLEGDHLVSQVGALRYPIRQGIPILLAEEAMLPPGYTSLDQFRRDFAAGKFAPDA